jgi:hypothetical protein
MKAVSAVLPLEKSKAYLAIFWGGLIAGALDITAACVTNGFRGISPIRVLQSVASGLFGRDSYRGGLKTAALGLVLHFIIAFGATIAFYSASRKLKFLVRQAIVCGALYGVAVYWFMQLVVLPLSAVPFKFSFTFASVVTGLIVHILCVGLPISLVVRRYSDNRDL